MLDDIYKIADQIMELQKIAILQYTPIVDNIIDVKSVMLMRYVARLTLFLILLEQMMDYLFKRLCPLLDQQAAVDYVEYTGIIMSETRS